MTAITLWFNNFIIDSNTYVKYKIVIIVKASKEKYKSFKNIIRN